VHVKRKLLLKEYSLFTNCKVSQKLCFQVMVLSTSCHVSDFSCIEIQVIVNAKEILADLAAQCYNVK
jgi:hypothetical protein